MPNNLYELIEQDNRKMVRLVQKNATLANFILAFTDHCVRWCEHRGIPFEDLHIHAPYIANFNGDEVVAAPLTRK